MSVSVQKQTVLPAHKWQVSCLEFSNDGLYLASGGWDKAVLLWDLRTLELSQRISFHKQPVTSISFQPKGPGYLATAAADQTIAIWDPITGGLQRTLQQHSNWILSTSFSANGQHIASASWDKTIAVCNVETGQLVASLTGHTTGVWSCSFSPDDSSSSNTICSGAEDGSLKLWDLRSKSVVISLVGGHEDRVKCCSWSPSSQYVASSSADGKVVLWEPRIGTALTKIKAYDDSANRVMFYPLSRDSSVPLLFSVGGRSCTVWHPFRKQSKQLLTVKLNKSGEEIQAMSISPDGSLLATGGSDKAISLSTVDISIDQVDALPTSESDDRMNRGTLLWKKYTRKVIESNAGKPLMKEPIPLTRKTSGSLVGMAINKQENQEKHHIERGGTPSHSPSLNKVTRKTSGSLVGMAVNKHEYEERHHVERAEIPHHNSSETLHAEPEVVFLHQRQKLRPRSENLSDMRKPDLHNQGQNELELQSARQHLRKVRRTSNGSEVSSGSGPEANGHDLTAALVKVNRWNGINGMSNGGTPSGYSSPPSSTADEQTVVVNIDSESDDVHEYHNHSNDHSIPHARSVNIQPSSRCYPFHVSNGNRQTTHHSNSPDDYESRSVSSSSYYADIDDVGLEIFELSKQVEDHRL